MTIHSGDGVCLVKTIASVLIAVSTFAWASTEPRAWKSVTGTTITATLTAAKNGQVQLKRSDGSFLTVPFDKFSEEDKALIKKDFPEVFGTAPQGSGEALITDGLAHPIGKVIGPLEAEGGTTYYLYIPTTLREGRKAPLLHFNGSGGGNANHVKKHIEGAELNGWILVANVQSKNGNAVETNHTHAKKAVAHALKTLPIDENRVYFTGGSGGGAMSFYNSVHTKSAGAMPHIGYIPRNTTLRGGYYFVISGTTDYNRYHSAYAVTAAGKNGIHRFFCGPHREGPEWLCAEGIIWLNAKYLIGNQQDSALAAERLDFEASILNWCEQLAEKEPHRAYYWYDFLKEEYQISGPNAVRCDFMHRELAKQSNNIAYVEGIKAISEFSKRQYIEHGTGGSMPKHITPKIEKAAEKLAEEYMGVPMIGEIAKELGKPTCGI